MGNKFEDKRDITITERALKVRSLRLAGLTYEQIGNKLNISIDTVRRDLERIKVDFPQRTARELVAIQNDKIEAMMTNQFIKAVSGNDKAISAMVKLLDHQAKLFNLYNLDMEGENSQAVEVLKQFFGMLRNPNSSPDDETDK